MNTLKIFLFGLGLLLSITSCNKDEPGIEFEIIGEQVLQAQPGETLEISFRFSDADGISQIVIESDDLGLDYLENVSSNPGSVTRDISVTIPDNYVAGQFYDITIQISDAAGYMLIDTINVDII